MARSCAFENVCYKDGKLLYYGSDDEKGTGFLDDVRTYIVRKGAPDGDFAPTFVAGPRPPQLPFSTAPVAVLFAAYCAENFGVSSDRSLSRSVCYGAL